MTLPPNKAASILIKRSHWLLLCADRHQAMRLRRADVEAVEAGPAG